MKYYPLRVIIADTLDIVVGDFGKLCLLAWRPLFVQVASGVAFDVTERYLGFQWLYPIGSAIVSIITGTLFLLAVHRYRLLGWGPTTSRVTFRFGARELRFLCFLAVFAFSVGASEIREFVLFELGVLGGPSVIETVVLSNVVLIGVVVLPIAAFLLLPRVLLALPAIALDQSEPLSVGWLLGKDTYWKLLGVVLVVGVPTAIIGRYILPGVPFVPLQIIVGIVLDYLPPAVIAIAVCYVYQRSTELRRLTWTP